LTIQATFINQDPTGRCLFLEWSPSNAKFISDHPIDPPKGDHDPWDCEFPEDCGFELKPVRGVYNIFRTKDDVIAGKPIEYEYPDQVTIL